MVKLKVGSAQGGAFVTYSRVEATLRQAIARGFCEAVAIQ